MYVSHTPVGDSSRLALGPNPGDLIVDGVTFNVKDLVGREPAKENTMTTEKTTDLEKRIADLERKQEAIENIGGGNLIVDGNVVNAAEARAHAATVAGVDPAATPAVALEDMKAEQAAIDAQRALDAKQDDDTAAAKTTSKSAKVRK
jgi:hypothetical protein